MPLRISMTTTYTQAQQDSRTQTATEKVEHLTQEPKTYLKGH